MKKQMILSTLMITAALPVLAENATSIDLQEFATGGTPESAPTHVGVGEAAEDLQLGKPDATTEPVFPEGYLELNALTQRHVARIAANIDAKALNDTRCQLVMEMAALAGVPAPRHCTEGN